MLKFAIVFGLVCVVVFGLVVFAYEVPGKNIEGISSVYAPVIKSDRPNIIFILADDMRWDEVDFMPFVSEFFKQRGVVFNNSFVTSPLCCASRASFISGGFVPHKSLVLNNQQPNGSAFRFQDFNNDSKTIATALQQAGYQTALVGKYLNFYSDWAGSHMSSSIPKGWTDFWGFDTCLSWYTCSGVFGSSEATQRGRGTRRGANGYLPYAERDQALSLISKYAASDKPFFLMFTPPNPHAPATPAPGDDELYTQFLSGGNYLYSGRGSNEKDVSDKPLYVQSRAGFTRPPTDFPGRRIQSLLSLDRSIKALVERVTDLGLLDKTVFIFASDNGFMLGEHGLDGKGKEYEESIRVPLLISSAKLAHRYIEALVSLDLDVPNYIFELAGLPSFEGSSGRRLGQIIDGTDPGPDHLFFESYAQFGGVSGSLDNDADNDGSGELVTPDWSALRYKDYKCVWLATEEEEFYDLKNDTNELDNQAKNPDYAEQKTACLAELAPLRGLTFSSALADFPNGPLTLPPATLNQAYQFKLRAVGGVLPYTWSLTPDSSALPKGLVLDSTTGEVSGIPIGPAGTKGFTVQVTDSSPPSPVNGQHQIHIRSFSLEVRS